jgi:class 3 adenylate cyclase
MRDQFNVLAAGWTKRGYQLGFGVGIGTGFSTLGRIGFEGRYDYGMVGFAVITAARLSAVALANQILLSPRTYADVEDMVEAEAVGELNLKGFSRPIAPMNVIRMRSGVAATAPAAF